ncbi:glutamate 5-kinase [Westerdykella ornata]|uniref:Glutamate 5-kinase n=1 Tax=Westerdykella ornata TaxID=318751 RepID=A0A6A6J7Y4_WESOR|nr:glutamate 5-kinase [Westerdykella ornata]KAF2272505.1 glutamate 5-kinase [Westerdykella ornata]
MIPARTIVIKLGTSSLIDETTHDIQYDIVAGVASTVAALRDGGYRVVLLSSGAVGFGLLRMGLPSRPSSLLGKQALAAIGQGEVMSMWSNVFSQRGIAVAQVLLTHDDIASPKRYDHAVNTFNELLSIDVVPIVNENDTLSTKEIQIGDNDTLGAITATMVHASYLFLLTDVDSLYASNPKHDVHASRIDLVTSISSLRERLDFSDLGAGSANGTGGMATKLRAAEIASAAGIFTVIASSSRPSVVSEILEYYDGERMGNGASSESSGDTEDGRPLHTLFFPDPCSRKGNGLKAVGLEIPPLMS